MTAAFYDELAPFYHLLYGDWEKAIADQGAALSDLLRLCGVEPGAKLLDAACGIGTQSLGLLERGYRVAASDISAGAVARLSAECSRRGYEAKVYVDDLRTLAQTRPESLQAVIACDNSIPHLLSDAEILQAFQSCYRCLQPGGIAVFSVRDYATIQRQSPDVRPYGLRTEADKRFLAVQAWEWEGDQYDLRMYLTSEAPDGTCTTKVLKSRYYAISVERLMQLLLAAGFAEVQRQDDVLFQPVILGRRLASA